MMPAVSVNVRLQAAEPKPDASSGATHELELRDTHGQPRSLAELASSRLVVLAFVGVECPLVKLYLPRLAELHDKYASQGVAFWGIDSNRQDTLEEIARLAAEHATPFPVLKDPGNVLADRLQVTRTPEVVVLDAEGNVRYRGRIDDRYEVTTRRTAAQRHDLAQALEQLLRNEPVSVAETTPVGCIIGREIAPAADADVTWSKQIAPIIQEHCQECHRPGQLSPLSLLTYEDVLGWGPTIAEVVEERRMPPWHADPRVGHFSNENRLNEEEVALIKRWVSQGTPEGDPSEAPPPREFAPVGWREIIPDVVLYMRPEPFEVPAEGLLEYQLFTVDPGFKEGKWIRGVECYPGNPGVVHHMDVFLLWPGEEKPDELRDLFAGFAPGAHPWIWPDGTAKYVPPGSKFVFQMHYTPNGTKQLDRSYMGLEFTDEDKVERPVLNGTAINLEFEVPAGARDHLVEANYRVTEDAELLTLTPHMHLRGKKFTFEARFPDGRVQPLLDVPNYDFNWQTTYRLSEPLDLPAGTDVHCVAHYDNSAENPNNPNPNVPVRFGYQTHDEMMIGYFEMAAKNRATRRGAPFHPATGPIAVAAATEAGSSWLLWLIGAGVGAGVLWSIYSTVSVVKQQAAAPAPKEQHRARPGKRSR
ncbi:MAG: redoxin domain-containing protein [Pirellulales bacterium]|nr:redoxin domain-containing protein [Pirellulales bacterium]